MKNGFGFITIYMKDDRKILVGLIILGIFTLVFGFFRLKGAIEGPFKAPKVQSIQITNEELHQALAKKDTDNDGLSDEEEIFQYHTSIYLDDSDSDGYNDKQEIEAGSDPLNSESTPLKKVAEKKETIIVPSPKEPTTEEIREIMIKLGIPKETLEQVDDETLKKMYDETVKETGVNPQDLSIQNLGQLDLSKIQLEQSSNQTNSQTDLSNLNTQQIRELLLSAGANPQVLSTMDDETLKKIFLEMMTKKE